MKWNPPSPTELREEPPDPPPVLSELTEDARAAFIDEIDRRCESMRPSAAPTSDILYDDAAYLDLGKRLANEHRIAFRAQSAQRDEPKRKAFESRREPKQSRQSRLAIVSIPDDAP
jgi:hypothetical protein